MDALDRLRTTNLIPHGTLDLVQSDLHHGGSLINHLHRRLGDATGDTWAALARTSGRTYYPTPSACGPIDTRLLPLTVALDHLVIPRVQKFNVIHVLTPDPLPRIAEYRDLLTHVHARVPGGQATLKLDVMHPAAFRELFHLAYPTLQEHYRTPRDAAALAALLPAREHHHHRPTPEETADALATFLNLPYIDPELEPPSAVHPHPLQPFHARRFHPHSYDTRGNLVVLTTLKNADALPGMRQRLQDLSDSLMQPMTPALTSGRRLNALLPAPGAQ